MCSSELNTELMVCIELMLGSEQEICHPLGIKFYFYADDFYCFWPPK